MVKEPLYTYYSERLEKVGRVVPVSPTSSSVSTIPVCCGPDCIIKGLVQRKRFANTSGVPRKADLFQIFYLISDSLSGKSLEWSVMLLSFPSHSLDLGEFKQYGQDHTRCPYDAIYQDSNPRETQAPAL